MFASFTQNHPQAGNCAGLGVVAVLFLLALGGCSSAPPPVASVQIPGQAGSPYVPSMQK